MPQPSAGQRNHGYQVVNRLMRARKRDDAEVAREVGVEPDLRGGPPPRAGQDVRLAPRGLALRAAGSVRRGRDNVEAVATRVLVEPTEVALGLLLDVPGTALGLAPELLRPVSVPFLVPARGARPRRLGRPLLLPAAPVLGPVVSFHVAEEHRDRGGAEGHGAHGLGVPQAQVPCRILGRVGYRGKARLRVPACTVAAAPAMPRCITRTAASEPVRGDPRRATPRFP